MRVATELPHFPQAEQTIEQVAAPQQLAPKERSCGYIVSLSHFVDVSLGGGGGSRTVPRLGTAISGRERRAPIAVVEYSPSGHTRRVDSKGEIFRG